MIEYFFYLILGIFLGIITGLLPGIHTNLASILISSFFISSPTNLAIILISMAITNSFIDFIPSIYLGAPEQDSSLSVLPGHDLLLQGKAHRAVIFSSLGALSSCILLVLLFPIFYFFLPFYPTIEKIMSFLLIIIAIILISKEKQMFSALLIFLLSGFLGVLTLQLPMQQPLLPLLSGLFGASTMLFSISKKSFIPKQEIEKVEIEKRKLFAPFLLSFIFSPLCSILPGLSNNEAATISSSIKKLDREQFLFLTGSISTLVLSLSLFTLFFINKARTGTTAIISQTLNLTPNFLLILIIVIFISSMLSFFLVLLISKIFSKIITKINYSLLSIFILIFLSIIVLFFSGIIGLLVFSTATLIGITCIFLNVRRSLLMSCLILPTIFLYLPI
jgi:putative membrane protein